MSEIFIDFLEKLIRTEKDNTKVMESKSQQSLKCPRLFGLLIVGLLITLLGIYFSRNTQTAEDIESRPAPAHAKGLSDNGVSQSQSMLQLQSSRLKSSAALRPRNKNTRMPVNEECMRNRLLAPYRKPSKDKVWPPYIYNYRSPCFHVPGGIKCFPYVHILGVAKSGTSMLSRQLIRHPDILESAQREEPFFSRPAEFNILGFLKDYEMASSVIYSNKNDGGYHPKIAVQANPQLFYSRSHTWPGNSTGPSCTLAHTLYAMIPRARLLVTIREPKARLMSHFRQEIVYGPGTKKYSPKFFHENVVKAISATKTCLATKTLRGCAYDSGLEKKIRGLNIHLFASLYYIYAAEWLNVFPRDQIHFIKAEEFYGDARGVMRGVFGFLELDASEFLMDTIGEEMDGHYQRAINSVRTNTSYHNYLREDTRKILDDFYAPYNRKLATLLEDDKWLFNPS